MLTQNLYLYLASSDHALKAWSLGSCCPTSCCLLTLPGGVLSCLIVCSLALQSPLISPSPFLSSNHCHSPPWWGPQCSEGRGGARVPGIISGMPSWQHRNMFDGDTVGLSLLPIPGYLDYPRAEVAMPLGLPIHSGLEQWAHGKERCSTSLPPTRTCSLSPVAGRPHAFKRPVIGQCL